MSQIVSSLTSRTNPSRVPSLWLNQRFLCNKIRRAQAEFKEFEPRLKYGWFHLKSHSLFKDLSRRSVKTGFWRFLDAAQIHVDDNSGTT